VGQTVAASLQAPKLFVIANDLTQMQVETRIDEADIGRIRPGLPVSFTVDAFPDLAFEGKVSQVRLEPVTEQNVVTYTTVIATRNDALQLRPGMTANVTVTVDTRRDALKVPNAALRFRPASAGAGGGAPRGGAQGNGGARRSVSWLLDRLAPPAYAQGAPAGAAPESRRGRRAAGPAAGTTGARDGSRGADSAAARGGGGGRAWSKGLTGGRSFGGAVAGGSPAWRPGQVYVLRDGKPAAVAVMTGITDGVMTEVRADDLKEGDLVVTGAETASSNRGQDLQPPAGMGGPRFGPPRGTRR
jgi:HlyD family secretion protein